MVVPVKCFRVCANNKDCFPCADRNRWRVGLPPFPKAVPPPAPPTEERTKEILADPRVQAAREKNAKAAENGQQRSPRAEGGSNKEKAEVKEKEKELVSTKA